MLNASRVLDRPSGIDRVLRPMRLFNTPHAGSSGAQLRVFGIGPICLGLLIAGVSSLAAAQSGDAATSRDAVMTRAADPQQVAMARALFEDGLRHVDREEWALAADRFGRVLELRYSAVAAYNLALARARLGSSVRALEGLRELLAQPNLESSVRDAALALQKEQNAYVGWVTVRVRGECSQCGVQLDDQPLPDATLGVAVPVDPGHHALALMRNDAPVARSSLSVARGARVEANLQAPAQSRAASANLSPAEVLEADGVNAEAPAGALAPSPETQSNRSLFASPWFWGGVGVLAAGVITLGVVLAAGGTHEATAVPGNFSPGVISGQVVP
jgi:hypothetical protein